VVLPPCPRPGCQHSLDDVADVVCTTDFRALASTCRGKKRVGEPLAAWVEHDLGMKAYPCLVCRQWHNGGLVAEPGEFEDLIRDTVQVLRDDPRVGWPGILNLADAWHPDQVPRSVWRDGLDQKQAYT
jgi:hypothetical protein